MWLRPPRGTQSGPVGESQEKLLWAAVFWVICEALGGITVGQVVESYRPQVHDPSHIGRSYVFDCYPNVAMLKAA